MLAAWTMVDTDIKTDTQFPLLVHLCGRILGVQIYTQNTVRASQPAHMCTMLTDPAGAIQLFAFLVLSGSGGHDGDQCVEQCHALGLLLGCCCRQWLLPRLVKHPRVLDRMRIPHRVPEWLRLA